MSWKTDPVTLRYFVAVCEEGAIAHAAEREFIAASAISKRIAEMEADIGTPLLLRSQRGVVPTVAGKALLRHARHVLQGIDHMHAEMREHGQGARGVVRVLANISSIAGSLPDTLTAFLLAHPKIRVEVDAPVSAEIVRGVAEGEADIGICRDVVDTSGLEVFPHHPDHLMLAVLRTHPLASQTQVDFVDTLRYEQIGVNTNSPITAMQVRMAANLGHELQFRLRVATIDAALRAVKGGLGLVLLPRETLRHYGGIEDLRIIALRDEWTRRHLLLCVRRVNDLSPAARLLFDALRASAAQDEPELGTQG
ncbi:LysR family transcriptional regulator [Pigmentiphaga aceris]|uniref:LysR family transcriptional regulator n=1 Tax=Pigmentiphaga aceris TaxID=1940612 RepID=A0A5C0B1Q1_9BURK|nr:LysR family transcriptional regulator [Pigmentiphaga aceris]QEI07804.1 LysR family transcriptional regulator [Pigmentiphaga aceris]